jgi:N utilization substance protein B
MIQDESVPAAQPEKRKFHKKGRSKKHENSHVREVAMQALFQIQLVQTPVDEVMRLKWLNDQMSAEAHNYCLELIAGAADHWDDIEEVIRSLSDKDISQISGVVLSILRIGVYEMMATEMDKRIVIDDLLNLTRQYDGEESVAFVNGILDRLAKERMRMKER